MGFSFARRVVGAVVLACGAVAGSASAQVFYEPVHSQYEYNGKTFYYGGRDGRVIEHALRDIDRTSYTSVATHVPVVHRQRVYSDGAPLENLADNSRSSYRCFTAADAQNEANGNVALYFRKRDLLRSAVLTTDGTFVVPADARPRVEVRVKAPVVAEPATRGTILIVPRKMWHAPGGGGATVALVK